MTEDEDPAQLEHDEFMRRAKFCLEFAAALGDTDLRASFIRMAAMWRRLAEGAKGRDRS